MQTKKTANSEQHPANRTTLRTQLALDDVTMSGERPHRRGDVANSNDATNPFPLEPGRDHEVRRKQTNNGRKQYSRRNDGSHRKTETPRHNNRKRNYNVGNDGHDGHDPHRNHNRNRKQPPSMKKQRETHREFGRERSGEFTGFVSPEEQEGVDTDVSSRATATLKGPSFSRKSTVVTSDSSLDDSMPCL
eukprot:scaffold270489_cov65-Attheya_sp.AAC.3